MAHLHSHAQPTTPTTEGMMIHWARRYDALVQVLTLGQARRLRRAIAAVVPLQPTDAILDVGCGTGDLALVMAPRVAVRGSVVGIDPSPEMIARAQAKARRLHAAATFQVAAAEALPFADQQFDHTVSSLVLHHLPGDLKQRALAEMVRVLQPGGTITIVDFLAADGRIQTHGGAASGVVTLPAWLRELGCAEVRTGALGFRSVGRFMGWPPLTYVQGRLALPPGPSPIGDGKTQRGT